MNKLLILGAIPSIIFFGPILQLVFSQKKFNFKKDAVSELNNFPKTKTKFIVWFSLWEISQLVYFFLLIKNKNLPVNSLWQQLALFLVIINIVTLHISSHKAKHVFTAILCFIISLFIMTKVTLLAANYLALLPIIFMVLCTIRIILSITQKQNIRFWLFEFAIAALMGVWNISIAF